MNLIWSNFTTSSVTITTIVVAALLAVSAITNLSEVNGNPYVISDNRVQNLDVTPVLGRGYSIMTNSFQSTCLDVNETTIPSFNYDCKYQIDLELLIRHLCVLHCQLERKRLTQSTPLFLLYRLLL